MLLYGGCSTRIKHDERERMIDVRSLVSCRKEKKREKKTYIKKMKRNKNKTEEEGREIFSSFFFFRYENVNLERDNHMRKILRWRVRFVRVHVCSCSSLSRGISTWPKKRFGRNLSSPAFSISFLVFFPLSFNSRIQQDIRGIRTYRVSRVRVSDLCGVFAYAWEREGVNIIINNVI